MANREKGEASLEVDGKTYTLVLDISAMLALEGLLSTPDNPVSASDVMASLSGPVKGKKPRVTEFVAVVWSAFQRHHPGFTMIDAADVIHHHGPEVVRAITEMSGSTVPDAKDVRDLGANQIPRKAQASKTRRGTGGPFTSMHDKSA